MLAKQEMLEKQLAALQQLVRDLSTNTDEQRVYFKKASSTATKMPTIMEEDEDQINEDEQHTNKDEEHTNKDEEHNTESKKKSNALRRFMKNLRAIFKRSK